MPVHESCITEVINVYFDESSCKSFKTYPSDALSLKWLRQSLYVTTLQNDTPKIFDAFTIQSLHTKDKESKKAFTIFVSIRQSKWHRMLQVFDV